MRIIMESSIMKFVENTMKLIKCHMIDTKGRLLIFKCSQIH